jgi:nucleotide-binding universal stress UspA family protein
MSSLAAPILCATDFSLGGRTAVEVAAALARRRGAPLRLIHVVEPAWLPLPEVAAAGDEPPEQLRREAEARLAVIKAEIENQGIAVQAEVALGSPAGAIVRAAQAARPRLIVVGTHGRQGPARLLLGSVASEVVQAAVAPVLVVRAGGTDPVRWQAGQLRLLAGLDGSPAAEATIDWLANGPLGPVNLRVVRLYWPPDEARRYGLEPAWQDGEGDPRMLALLARDLRPLLDPLGLPAAALEFRVASVRPAAVLLEQAAREPTDALLIGVAPGGAAAWNALDFRDLLRRSSLPVLCIPDRRRPAIRPIPALRSILVPLDLSPASAAAVGQAVALLGAAGGRIELCHVHERGRSGRSGDLPLMPALGEADRRQIEDGMRALVPSLGADGPPIEARVSVAEGDLAPEGILQAAERLDVDLIVMTSHGRSGWKRAVLGSVAEQVTRRATRPVLLVHGPEQQAALALQ